MVKTYCVPIDCSEDALRAAALCARMCNEGDIVHLFSSIARTSYHIPKSHHADSRHRALHAAADLFTGKKVDLKLKMDVCTDVRSNITDYLDSVQPDCVFMGSRGLGDIRGVIGSVSQYVLHHYEKGSICILKHSAKEKKEESAPQDEKAEEQAAGAVASPEVKEAAAQSGGLHYFLCVDDSKHAERAAKFMAGHIKETDTLTCFASKEAPPQYYPIIPAMAMEPVAVQWKDNTHYEKELTNTKKEAMEVAEKAKKLVLETVPTLKEEQVVAAFSVDVVGPAKAICQKVDNPDNKIDIVVMGTRGLGLIRRMVLGSVSNEVLHSVEGKPFLVVH